MLVNIRSGCATFTRMLNEMPTQLGQIFRALEGLVPNIGGSARGVRTMRNLGTREALGLTCAA
jgi:hypothetical protein